MSLSGFEKLFFGESVDEQSENVVDHIIRKLLLHPNKVDKAVDTDLTALSSSASQGAHFHYSWSDAAFLNQIYDDKTFPQIVQNIYTVVLPQCFKTTTSISQKITLTKSLDDHAYDLIAWSQYVNLLSSIQLKEKDTSFKDKEMFVWSFCVLIATKIKYLELSALLSTREATTYKSKAFTDDRMFHFRSLQGLIQKFVLELSESSASRSLWEWHDSLLNDTDQDLKELDNILRYNGEYRLNRKKGHVSAEELTPYSFKPFTYPNVRYIRKCAANLLLDERLTAKQLFEIHKTTLPIGSTGTPSVVPPPVPAGSRLLPLQSISIPMDSVDLDLDDEILTDAEKNTFKMVFNTVFKDTLDDPKCVELKKLLKNAILMQDTRKAFQEQKEPKEDEKEQKEDDAYNDKPFVALRSYFTALPSEFETSQQKESICNPYDVLLLRLGIEYGFDLHKIKKLLWHYKKFVRWDFRQFFKAKIRVLIRMKYLSTLILANAPKSYFCQSIATSRSTVFRDGFQRQQHLKYCAHFERFDLYRHPISTPKAPALAPELQEMEPLTKPAKDQQEMENDAIDALKSKDESSPPHQVQFERNVTIIVNPMDDEKSDAEAPLTAGARSLTETPPQSRTKSPPLSPYRSKRSIVHRKRSSFDIGVHGQFESLALSVVHPRDIQQEIRDSIHFYEMYELEDDIVQYIIHQIRVKTDRRVIEGLWKILIIILSQLPLASALRLVSTHWDAVRNKQISNVKFIQTMVETLICGNAFPIATALFLSAWLEERAEDDITRRDAWLRMAEQCESIAEREVEKINSDHVLCLLLYAPTDIQLMSTLNLAIRYNRVTFLHHPYITGILESLWSNGNPMMADPLRTGSLFDLKADEFRKSLWRNPTQFIYAAFGLALLHGVLYVVSLGIITYYATINQCENLHIRPQNGPVLWECVVLAVVFSLLLTEVAEFIKDSKIYLSKLSNLFDCIASCMWLTIMVIRLWQDMCLWVSDTVSRDVCIPSDSKVERMYHGFWAIVIILMYLKIPVVFQFTGLMGRFNKTISLLVRDIFTFLVMAAVFFLGFLFCLYILGASGHTGTGLDSLEGTASVLYDTFFTLSGPSDLTWADNDVDTPRKYWIVSLLVTYQVLAAVLLLNLLIAMMSDTYRNVFEQALAETNFYKIEQTTSCVQPFGRLIGTFSLVILIVCWILNTIVIALQFAVYCCTQSRWLFDVNRFETWCWMYDDFWSTRVLCYWMYDAQSRNEMEAQHKATETQGSDVHDYTKSELRLSPNRERNAERNLVYESKLYEMSQELAKQLVIDNDYRANDLSADNDRKRCCFCCIKQRKKSKPLNKQIQRYLHVGRKTEIARGTLRLAVAPVTPISGKVIDDSNLLYSPDVDPDSDSDSSSASPEVNEHSYFVPHQSHHTADAIQMMQETKLTRYKTYDKGMCRQTLERNRRLNKVRNNFQSTQSQQGMCGWYKRWQWYKEFVDNETFCPNCFIGSPTRSIEEYGTVSGFIKAVEKRFEYVIKRNDRMVLRRALKDSILCQRCFYPLHCNTFHDERKTRFQIMVEIMSTYFYYVLMWIPMLILVVPFGCVGTIRNKAKQYGSAQSLLWNIEERKNFHQSHDLLLPDHKYQIEKSANLYHNALKVSFDSDDD